MQFPKLDNDLRMQRLQPPPRDRRLPMVLDTDTYNEIDDQFAVVHAMRSPDRLDVRAIYAAPFHNKRSTGAGDGMTKSYDEIFRVLGRINVKPEGLVHRGSDSFLTAADAPVDSDAARDLIRRAMDMPAGEPLYVAAIGAITNVASALLMEPRLVERIVVVWLGGQPLHADSAREFNLQQDLYASRLMFDSGVPLVLAPCNGVTSHLLTTIPELQAYLGGKGPIAEYLLEIVKDYTTDPFCWSKVIWDIAATSYLINPEWLPTKLVPAPHLTDEYTWRPGDDGARHPIRVVSSVRRDAIFRDVIGKVVQA